MLPTISYECRNFQCEQQSGEPGIQTLPYDHLFIQTGTKHTITDLLDHICFTRKTLNPYFFTMNFTKNLKNVCFVSSCPTIITLKVQFKLSSCILPGEIRCQFVSVTTMASRDTLGRLLMCNSVQDVNFPEAIYHVYSCKTLFINFTSLLQQFFLFFQQLPYHVLITKLQKLVSS